MSSKQMVIYDTIKAFKEKGVYQIALKSGLINPSVVYKTQIYEYYVSSNELKNKDKLKATCAYFQIEPDYAYKAIRYIREN